MQGRQRSHPILLNEVHEMSHHTLSLRAMSVRLTYTGVVEFAELAMNDCERMNGN